MSDLILVTGATGNVGSAVVDKLISLGARIRAAALNPGRLQQRHGSNITAVRLDLTDPAAFEPAVRGTRRMFLIRPPAISRVGPTVNRLIDAALDAGVEHITFSSVAGADTNRAVPHHRIERHLTDSGLDWTILRPGFFSQNIESAYRTDIIEHDQIILPAGSGKVAFIDTRDIGHLAAMTLVDDHQHRLRHRRRIEVRLTARGPSNSCQTLSVRPRRDGRDRLAARASHN